MKKIQNEIFITTDKSELDIDFIYQFLSGEAYWSKNIPEDIFKKSIENSLNFGIFYKKKQIGFARVITDFSTVAYLADVFIINEYRGKGYSKILMKEIMNYPELQGLRRWVLVTRDAHGLYRQFGWKNIANPERWMEVHNPDTYKPKVNIDVK